MRPLIQLLAKRLIPNWQHTEDPAVRRGYGVLCGVVGICLNVLLFLGKILAGTVSGSIAITADAFNNLSDAGSSVVTLLGFKLAAQEPDRDHPFGHGRMEYISGLVVAMLILLMGVELLKSSVSKILHPEEVSFSILALVILAVSIAVKFYMSLYNRAVGKRIDSAAMLATATDSRSDVLATTAVLASTVVGHFTGLPIDGWCGLVVAVLILKGGFGAAVDTVSPLLGQAPASELVQEVEQLVLAHKEIVGIHDLVVHDYGPGRLMITLHAEVPADGDMLELHDVVDTVERELAVKMRCVATIHMDPVVTDETTMELRHQVEALAQTVDRRITIHDFRIVPGPTHTNLVFDAMVPFDLPMEEKAAERAIRDKVRQLPGNYYAVVHAETSYV